MFELECIAPATYRLPKRDGMHVDGLVIATEKMLEQEEVEKPLEQVRNVATLPGIVGYSIAMPDMHWGYGFPIGGVAAMREEDGVISPGGVGYDINCGVRFATIPVSFSSLSETLKENLVKKLFELIPSGVGHGHRGRALTDDDYRDLFTKGAAWSVEKGLGFEEDLLHMEENGKLQGADFFAVSDVAKERGKQQLGSIGSGNHFVEIGEISELICPKIAAQWGIEQGMTYILIHSGSRGLGHQVCQDTLDRFVREMDISQLVDRQLVYAPLKHPLGKQYMAAMAAAANYAFNNRQHILHEVRMAIKEVCDIAPEKVRLLYDVCHNIAKWEEHQVDGKMQRLCVHRKGATRAFGPYHPELAPIFQETGQPVIVPGDMGRASMLLVGKGEAKTWCSCCHGAGRVKSRMQSMKTWKGKDLKAYMLQQGVHVRASSYATLAEEMPDAYKDVGEVTQAVCQAGLADAVARCTPGIVIKG